MSPKWITMSGSCALTFRKSFFVLSSPVPQSDINAILASDGSRSYSDACRRRCINANTGRPSTLTVSLQKISVRPRLQARDYR
jgi:hypothetical protein